MVSRPVIVCDESIPYWEEAFGLLGTVRPVPSAAITAGILKDARVLIVRSRTRVDAELLAGTQVAFVGSATSGIDHIDTAFLRKRRIRFASAPGSNAESVADYVIAILCTLARERILDPGRAIIGIIGVGHVGKRVAAKCRALGMTLMLNDPPLQRRTGSKRFLPLDRLLKKADVVTLHVPLTRSGAYPTWQMVDERFIGLLRKGAILINTSRGDVVHEPSLRAQRRRLAACALDVWAGEPEVNVETVHAATLATPHIAGYAVDGKVRATEMVQRALCSFLGVKKTWRGAAFLHPPVNAVLPASMNARGETLVEATVLKIYDPRYDDQRFRSAMEASPEVRAAVFERLRREYPPRREFGRYTIEIPKQDARQARRLAGLGFRIRVRG